MSLCLKILVGEIGQFHQMGKQPAFERLVRVHTNGQAHDTAGFPVDVMAAVDAKPLLSVPLNDLCELLAGKLLHTTISSTRSLPVFFACSTSTDMQPSTAS
jgi:hypothetical protein